MTSGITTKEMMKGIQFIHITEPYLVAVYGFGSFFRSDHYGDCDILLVVANDCPCLGKLHEDLCRRFFSLGEVYSIIFDLTILTEREHEGKPLIEHDFLIPISVSGGCFSW